MKKFEKFVNEIGNSFSVPVSKLVRPANITVWKLGMYFFAAQQRYLDLSEYYIDEQGDMFTLNDDTYFTKYGNRLKILSNGAFNGSGSMVNSFRAKDGTKITIRRQLIKQMRDRGELERLSFDELPVVQGNINTKNFQASVG